MWIIKWTFKGYLKKQMAMSAYSQLTRYMITITLQFQSHLAIHTTIHGYDLSGSTLLHCSYNFLQLHCTEVAVLFLCAFRTGVTIQVLCWSSVITCDYSNNSTTMYAQERCRKSATGCGVAGHKKLMGRKCQPYIHHIVSCDLKFV